jgi:hypothetical protein
LRRGVCGGCLRRGVAEVQCLVGTTALDGAEAGPVPTQLVAVTVKV